MENISLKSIKWESIKSIFHVIASSDQISRSEISKQTGLSLMTVGKVADALLDMHIVVQAKESKSSAGRRAGLLSLSPENYAVILDLTSRNFIKTVINMRLNIVEKYHYSYIEDYYFEENLTLFLKEVSIFLSRNLRPESCIGFGVSLPGSYAPETDRYVGIRLPELSQIPIAESVAVLSPSRLAIESCFNAAATSNIARIPNYRDKSILYCFVGENNVGGTVVHHGEILRGAHNAAGNFGHMIIQRGRTLDSAIRADNTPAENAFELAKAIRNMIMVIDPDTIILECELYRNYNVPEGECSGEEFLQLTRQVLVDKFEISPESLPDFISGGCKFRHSHRGLAMKLREQWLYELIFGNPT